VLTLLCSCRCAHCVNKQYLRSTNNTNNDKFCLTVREHYYQYANVFHKTRRCWQHYVIHCRCQPTFPILSSLFKQKKLWYAGTVKIRFAVCRPESLRTPVLCHMSFPRSVSSFLPSTFVITFLHSTVWFCYVTTG
jgi:hypothetical protein